MTDSQTLLAEYTRNGSDAAFRELVTRYVDLVFSTALRLVEGDAHRAEDVVQTVFVDLARVARTLPVDVKLGGWLHRNTCFAAATLMRGERRRQARERQAVEMNTLQNHSGADFSEVAPLLDEAINELSEEDRMAILLRYFEQQDFHAVGQALGSNDDAARMRVRRAVEKLEGLLKRRGVTTSAASLGVGLTANAVQVAPVGLAVTVSNAAAAALAATPFAATPIATQTTVTTMNWLNMKSITAIVVAAIAAGTGTHLVQQGEVNHLRGDNRDLMEQQAMLVRERDTAFSAAKRMQDEIEQFQRDKTELLRLRGEVRALRQGARELEQAATQAKSAASEVLPTAATPSPFQLHLVVDTADDNTEAMTREDTTSDGSAVREKMYVQKVPLMDHTAIRSASVVSDVLSGTPQIEIRFTDQGREQLAKITKENVNKRIAMTLDGKVYSAPIIRAEIPSGVFQITGRFTEEQARELAAKMNAALGNP